MKLRIRSNTLRFRLGQGEVVSLAEKGFVEEHIQFGSGAEKRLTYRIESSPDVESIGLRYEPGQITVLVGIMVVTTWADSDMVGIKENVNVEDGIEVSLLIEKDFACLKPRDPKEDEGAFPHPEANTKC